MQLLTGESAFPAGSSKETVMRAVLGGAPLPWEVAPVDTQRKLLRLKGPILQCLRRDPAARPSAAGLLRALAQINMQSTRAGAPQ